MHILASHQSCSSIIPQPGRQAETDRQTVGLQSREKKGLAGNFSGRTPHSQEVTGLPGGCAKSKDQKPFRLAPWQGGNVQSSFLHCSLTANGASRSGCLFLLVKQPRTPPPPSGWGPFEDRLMSSLFSTSPRIPSSGL